MHKSNKRVGLGTARPPKTVRREDLSSVVLRLPNAVTSNTTPHTAPQPEGYLRCSFMPVTFLLFINITNCTVNIWCAGYLICDPCERVIQTLALKGVMTHRLRTTALIQSLDLTEENLGVA